MNTQTVGGASSRVASAASGSESQLDSTSQKNPLEPPEPAKGPPAATLAAPQPTPAQATASDGPLATNALVSSQSAHPVTSSLPASPTASAFPRTAPPPSALNKQLLSKLNKSIREKQKIITQREPQSRAPTQLQEIVGLGSAGTQSVALDTGTPNEPVSEPDTDDAAPRDERARRRRVAKQALTRTDFFAAKLALAVDDVSLLDSDETFVYESGADGAGSTSTGAAGPAVAAVVNGAPLAINGNGHGALLGGGPSGTTAVAPLNGGGPGTHLPGSPDAVLLVSVRPDVLTLTVLSPHERLALRAESVHSVQLKQEKRGINLYERVARRKGSQHSLLSDRPDTRFLDERRALLDGRMFDRGVYDDRKALSNSDERRFDGFVPSIHEDEPYGFGETTEEADDGHESGENGKHVPATADMDGADTVPRLTSLKLRSTTSKLFDKNGAQPRRYLTIPDDFDIEDFDDELIYYDNHNIRFPHHGLHATELSLLLPGPKLPHYRLLNLSLGNKRRGKTKRYQLVGYGKEDYGYYDEFYDYGGENNQYGQVGYAAPGPASPFTGQTPAFGSPRFHGPPQNRLLPSNTHFMLPRKVSSSTLTPNRLRVFKNVIYLAISIIVILLVGFALGFLLASTKELTDVAILSIDNTLISQDELVFSMVVGALNPSWFTVEVQDVELDIFAKSGYLSEPGASSVETVLLGTVIELELPVVFDGSFFAREPAHERGEIKLLAPGKNLTSGGVSSKLSRQAGLWSRQQNSDVITLELDSDNSDKWNIILKHPFDLVIRGVLKYTLPLSGSQKSVVVSKVSFVDPLTNEFK